MARTNLAKEITFGVFGSLTDIVLYTLYLTGASFGKIGPRGVTDAFREADQMLEQVNHRTLAALLRELTKKRLITYKKRGGIFNIEITEFGKQRLKQATPKYFTRRPWDKKIYLITYDIPETVRKKRDLLRYYLRENQCRLLQESTWVTPYNPRQLINDFVRKQAIPGSIIVSDVGKDGGIGETSIQDLIVRLYKLEKLNDRYEGFIHNVENKAKPLKFLLIEYLSILKDDPQLPFELLPQGFSGDTAYHLYHKLIKSE